MKKQYKSTRKITRYRSKILLFKGTPKFVDRSVPIYVPKPPSLPAIQTSGLATLKGVSSVETWEGFYSKCTWESECNDAKRAEAKEGGM